VISLWPNPQIERGRVSSSRSIRFLEYVKTKASPEDALAVACVGASAPILAAPIVEENTDLDELARRINQAHSSNLEIAGDARAAARYAIERAVVCGQYLRVAKAKIKAVHGRFLPWLKRDTGIQPRTAQNYMNLHKWVSQHQGAILERKPHSLRQLYILAGILPEDDAKTLSLEKPEELSRLRRFVRRTCLEAAVHIGYVPSVDIMKVLQPLVALLEEVGHEETGAHAKHISPFDDAP
jgi:hypothetical protein